MCGELSADSIPEKFVFHRRTLCAELMVTNSKLGHHLLAMQSSLLLEYVLSDGKVEVLIPNLSKYLGRYSTKKAPNLSNKRKEKEKKEKKSKEEGKTPKQKPDAMHNHLSFIPSDMLEWLGNVTPYMQKKWLKSFSEEMIVRELDKAINYFINAPSSKKWKSKTSGFDNWLGRQEPDNKECEFFSYLKELDAKGDQLRAEQFAESEKKRRAHCQLVK